MTNAWMRGSRLLVDKKGDDDSKEQRRKSRKKKIDEAIWKVSG